MDRKEELLNVIDDDSAKVKLIDDMLYLEEQLDYLRELPKIKVHPDDPSRQKSTPAAKLYKEYLQQYINIVKVLSHGIGEQSDEGDSILRRWMSEKLDDA